MHSCKLFIIINYNKEMERNCMDIKKTLTFVPMVWIVVERKTLGVN